MRTEDYGIAGRFARALLRVDLAGLFIVQYVALAIHLEKLHTLFLYQGVILMLIYPLPMIFGLALMQALNSSRSDESRLSYYKRIDWTLLTLIAAYGCMMKFPNLN